jgi:hypothetical protein
MATTQTYGFRTKPTQFPTLRQPAGVSPLKSLYGTSMQNPVSDVLSTSTRFYPSTKPTAPSGPSVLDGGDSGNGFGGTDTGVGPGSPYASGITPKVPATPAKKPFDINDLSADPLLHLVEIANGSDIADSEAAALAGTKNAVIGAGLGDVPDTLRALFANDSASPILAGLTDANTLTAAKQNPDSMLAQLAKQHPLAQSGIDAASNEGNLFYGSRHAEALANEADQYRQAQQGVYSQVQSVLSQLLGGVLNARTSARDRYANALPDAYGRVVAANDGSDSGGGSDPGGPGAVVPPAGTGQSGAVANPFHDDRHNAPTLAALLAAVANGGSGANQSRLNRWAA